MIYFGRHGTVQISKMRTVFGMPFGAAYALRDVKTEKLLTRSIETSSSESRAGRDRSATKKESDSTRARERVPRHL
jgi:hypothetical protein